MKRPHYMLRKPLGAAKCSFIVRRFQLKRLVCKNTAVTDMDLVIQADCNDGPLPPVALTTSAELVQQSPEAILNNANRPLLVTLLLLLHRRGVLEDRHTRLEMARFLVPSVHRDSLPWLWGDNAETLSSSCGDISALRFLPPSAWRGTVERKKPNEPSEQLHYWHQVFFALSANSAFAETGTFDNAHRELLTMVHDYYNDIIHVQELLPPLVDAVVVTRMPPVLLRKLRKSYVEQYRLVQYAELFRAIIDGEELVAPTDGTALLHDSEVFEYYLTIPGRRESGIERDKRWACTLDYAIFSLLRLFRQQHWKGISISVALSRPVTLLMNVCVFVKNDNAEGYRYREAILTIMRTFHAHYGNDNHGNSDVDVVNSLSDSSWDLLRLVRDTGVESMLAKCKRLHFGPMRGLLDVCTVAAMTEILLSPESNSVSAENPKGNFHLDELEIFLSPRKLIGEEMYDAATSHSQHHFGARYGLLNLGARISAALHTVVQLPGPLQRYRNELAKWGAFIGRSLRLNMYDVPSVPLLALPSLTGGTNGKSVESWRCGCKSVNLVQPRRVSCIGCTSQDLVEHEWTCPHCSWISTSGDYIDTCLSCNRPHPNRILAQNGDVIPTENELPVTPFLWYCERCSSYSPLGGGGGGGNDAGGADAAAAVSGRRSTCADCGLVGRGWSTRFFEWTCGCGKVNHPFRRWCQECSMKRNHASCICVACRKEWKLQPRRTLAHTTGNTCPSCNAPHPRDVTARQRSLVRCPLCHWLTSTDAERCQNCKQPLWILRQFLVGLSDWPWLCHVCGRQHHHRDADGVLSPPWRESADACEGCGALRIDPALFGMDEPWLCGNCEGPAVRGFSCPRCFSLHPAIPAVEVHAWCCVACLTVNSSWNATCQRRGCGTRRSADSTTLPYSPWRCSHCREYSRSSQVPQCEHCGSVRMASCYTVKSTADDRRLGRVEEVEKILENMSIASSVESTGPKLEDVPTDDWTRCIEDIMRLSIPLG